MIWRTHGKIGEVEPNQTKKKKIIYQEKYIYMYYKFTVINLFSRSTLTTPFQTKTTINQKRGKKAIFCSLLHIRFRCVLIFLMIG